MTESLNVIALISGGKDSIYSILHCLQNGQIVVALGNLYPPPISDENQIGPEPDEHDLNSFMYQSVGHTVIPLYERALGIPLYRQVILGGAIQTGSSYQPPVADDLDETEALVPLLASILLKHPEANAVSTGAILSTYQRTRIESVVLRLGLVPLSYLWQYPILPPGAQISLLQDMSRAGLDARIIKVASGGLDESFLWENVASDVGMRRIEKAITRFGIDGDGAVLGEGGEFETLVLDGPDQLFKGRIIVADDDKMVVREDGGVAWLKFGKIQVEMKSRNETKLDAVARIPDLFDAVFSDTLDRIRALASLDNRSEESPDMVESLDPVSREIHLTTSTDGDFGHKWTLVPRNLPEGHTTADEMADILSQMKTIFQDQHIDIGDVNSTMVLLRSMNDFASINKIYGAFFNDVNPPARVTIAVGGALPSCCNVILHVRFSEEPEWKHMKKALHVQSRSYWAPANIGPYAQAQSTPLFNMWKPDEIISGVCVAGQIPLVPATMALPLSSLNPGELGHAKYEDYSLQAVLSLQHLWRIGKTMDVSWWTGAVAFLSRDTGVRIAMKAKLAGMAWEHQNFRGEMAGDDDEEDDDRDLWEERHHGGFQRNLAPKVQKPLPDWSTIDANEVSRDYTPPFFAAEVEELPRGSDIEWHAQLGITNGPIKLLSHSDPSMGVIHKCIVANEQAFTTVMIPYREDIQNSELDESLDTFRLAIERLGISTALRNSTGYHCSYASYADASIKGLWDATDYGGIVPCRSLWDKDGNRLAVVLLFRSILR